MPVKLNVPDLAGFSSAGVGGCDRAPGMKGRASGSNLKRKGTRCGLFDAVVIAESEP